MIFFISSLFILARSINCKGSNTISSTGNKCVCADGFPYGDPNSIEGCFKCDQECHIHSVCKYPGKCVCLSPYYSDGASNCIICRPHLFSIMPNSGPAEGGTVVKIQYNCLDKKNIPKEAFCKFGSNIENSTELTDTTITSITPKHAPVPALISISFDMATWSQEKVFYNFIDFFLQDDEYEDEKEEEEEEYHQTQKLIEFDNTQPENHIIFALITAIFSSFFFLFMIIKNSYKSNELPFSPRKKRFE